MKILIVEDEPLIARNLERFCREILGSRLEMIHHAGALAEAEGWLQGNPIDLLLLDLNLGGDDGLQLLAASVAESFRTVIVSANTEQALRAFEFGVRDFVPKPFTRDRLAQALRRAGDATDAGGGPARYLAVKKHGKVEVIPIQRIRRVQGADSYAELILDDGRRELHNKTLEELAQVLPADFERIHRSHLVRLSDVKSLHVFEGSTYEAELADGTRCPVGRTRYKALRAKLE